jgi:hypothetical protein
MITNITNTPAFASKNSQIIKIVDNTFKKLAHNRLSQNRTYFATAPDNVDIFVSESKLGKQAEISLSNGKFNNKSYAKFTMKRSSEGEVEIIPEDEKMNKSEVLKILARYFG